MWHIYSVDTVLVLVLVVPSMASVQWMFQDSPDQEADVSMMLELRNELADVLKSSEKIVGVMQGPQKFVELCKSFKQHSIDAKAWCLIPANNHARRLPFKL